MTAAHAFGSLQFINVGGRERSYLLHLPPQAESGNLLPLVLVFHGSGTHAGSMAEFCGLHEKAADAGFVVVYPNGTGRVDHARTWNAGHCCGHAFHQQVNDVEFISTLLDELLRTLPLDPARVYAAGMSNGGMMAYRLAADLSARFAAVASITGPMGSATCSPAQPVPVLHFHGTNDQFAPFSGGVGPRSIGRVAFYSVEHTIAQWVQANGCPETPEIEQIPDVAGDGFPITRRRYGPGTDNAEVVLYVIEGGGHTWPGRTPPLEFLGPVTHSIQANDLLWDFFCRFSR